MQVPGVRVRVRVPHTAAENSKPHLKIIILTNLNLAISKICSMGTGQECRSY